MDKKMKLIAGIILFGSLWGFSEVIIGSALSEIGLPSGAIMTAFFALFLLVISRKMYTQPGMQFGMGMVAGALRLFNPFAGCHLCSALAIMAEGAIFEIIWYNIQFNFKGFNNLRFKASLGIVTVYSLYVGGYIVTQILTPIVGGGLFYVENLVSFIPRILANGLLPAIIGAIMLPATLIVTKLDLTIKDKIYYPTTLGISAFCWIIVLSFWFILGA